ncbi:hypothetical protein [Gloeobacter kilaueensis]|uniref:Uncharacterized protein n=1 Tax=Gloeobacter kilaueensis (strain ATCC BAA-2537 / CCAP 1431/1 / ULC 316 / JS1) TaxID=1183438 RepID=U5QFA8_GLOK1|nr:hypothetical protein [Gloeobacter kilaueensis]AGY56340.1 hypothetical protein GKIL_0093 [Gloeobacter kilaueensis JS1]
MAFLNYRFARLGFAAVVLSSAALFTSYRLPAGAQSQQDILVSDPDAQVVDPEFDQATAQFTWTDKSGTLWVSGVDPVTGAFVPSSAKGISVDPGAVPVGRGILNGPEWVLTSSGSQIVYSKYDANRRPAIALAQQVGGLWSGELLPNSSGRSAPIGSLDPGDPKPRMSYTTKLSDGSQVSQWREINDASTEETIPGSGPAGDVWVMGKRSISLTESADRSASAIVYDTDQKTIDTVAAISSKKAAVYCWNAPEYSQYVCFVQADDKTISIYRKFTGIWSKVLDIKPPSAGPFISSPQYFVHNGKSYIYMVTSTSSNAASRTVPSEIWLAGIDAVNPFYRRVSDNTERVRKDPEVFVTAQGPSIYFQVINTDDSTPIYRADTGLGPAQ